MATKTNDSDKAIKVALDTVKFIASQDNNTRDEVLNIMRWTASMCSAHGDHIMHAIIKELQSVDEEPQIRKFKHHFKPLSSEKSKVKPKPRWAICSVSKKPLKGANTFWLVNDPNNFDSAEVWQPEWSEEMEDAWTFHKKDVAVDHLKDVMNCINSTSLICWTYKVVKIKK